MLRSLCFYLVAAPWTLLMLLLGLLVMFLPGAETTLQIIARRLWAPVWLWAGGARVEGVGRLEALDPSQPCVFVSNHQSYFDIPATLRVVPHKLRFVAKRELLLVPLLNLYLWRMGCPIVDRGNRASAVRTFDRAVARIRSGVPILVYAEGTRTRDGQVAAFKRGALILAIRSGVPIVPLTISGSFQIFPKHSWSVHPGVIRVYVDEAIPTEGLTLDDRHALSERVRKVIVERFARLEAERVSAGQGERRAEARPA